MNIVNLKQLQSTIDFPTAIDAVKQALSAMASKNVEAPRELAFNLGHGGEIHIKGARLKAHPFVVFKVASGSFPEGGNSGCSILLDAETGEPQVLLNDGGWLTEMRTAAAGAIATDVLANAGPLNVAILGTGVQAQFQLNALRSMRELHRVTVWGRTDSKLKAFAKRTSTTPCRSIGEAVEQADVIVTTTSATRPILLGHHVKAGVHITAMGADMIGKRELADDVLTRAAIVAADDLSTCVHVGELQYADAQRVGARELAELYVEKTRGSAPRRSSDDITVADMCGTGAFDAAIAAVAVGNNL